MEAVGAVDVLGNGNVGDLPAFEVVDVLYLALERREEALSHGVVPAIALAAHAAFNAFSFQGLSVVAARVRTATIGVVNPCCPEIHRRRSWCLPMVIVQQSAEGRPTGDLAICPVVIRRTDVPDELATDALVKTLGHVVLDEFPDQVAQMSLAENCKVIQALVLDGFDKSFRVGIAIRALCRDLRALNAVLSENLSPTLRRPHGNRS